MKKKIVSLFLCLGILVACFMSPIITKADVIQAAVTEVKLNQSVITVRVGKTATLKATIYPISSNYLNVSFKASNSNISLKKISHNSISVTGKKAGTSTITAIARATGSIVDVKKECKVIISSGAIIAPKSVKISSDSKTSSKTTYIGDSCTLKATVSPSNATNKNITWKSSDTTIAVVDSKGKVSGKTSGTVTITATITGTNIKDTYKVIVKRKSLKIAPTSLTLNVGNKKKIEVVKVAPSNAKIIWRSNNPSVATVDSLGNVRAKKSGNATITAAIYGANVQKRCKVTVK
ncbi:MAG: Ig domain-containing protein [Lachnospiraceae bacterium]